jgi:hypothetical protein
MSSTGGRTPRRNVRLTVGRNITWTLTWIRVIQWLRLALSKGPNRVAVFLLLPEDWNKRLTKSRNPAILNNVLPCHKLYTGLQACSLYVAGRFTNWAISASNRPVTENTDYRFRKRSFVTAQAMLRRVMTWFRDAKYKNNSEHFWWKCLLYGVLKYDYLWFWFPNSKGFWRWCITFRITEFVDGILNN